MKDKYPHILQTSQWRDAKCSSQTAWCGNLWVKYVGSEDFQICEQIDDWSKVRSSALILERNLPLGQKMHYIPRGPFVDWDNEGDVDSVLSLIKSEAEKKNVIFTRFEPNSFDFGFPYKLIEKTGFKRTHDFVQAQDTVKIEIDKNDEDLMSSFHKKHRYNIRLAKKRGLIVRSSTDPKDISIFYKLTQKTDQHSGGAMNPHSENYYQTIVHELGKSGMAKVYIVEKEGKAISASIVFIFGEEAIYMFGAADYDYRRDMPNHLREWVSMTESRDAGCKLFDLWGVTMRKDPGEGIKRYKLGYRNNIDKMAGTFDYAPSLWKYNLFNWANKIRRGR